MRPLIVFIIIIIVAVSAYYDLQEGTIPHLNNENSESIESHNDSAPPQDKNFEEVKVEAGQTVYAIVQEVNEGHFNKAPHQVIKDFETLNPQVSAHEIIIGHSYRFPIYTKND